MTTRSRSSVFGLLRTFAVRCRALRCRAMYRCGSAVAVPACSGAWRSRARTAARERCLFNAGVSLATDQATANGACARRHHHRTATAIATCRQARLRRCEATAVVPWKGFTARSGHRARARRAPQARVMPAHRLDAWATASFAKRCRWIAKTGAGAWRRASAAPRSAGACGQRAQRASCHQTRRDCPSAANAVSAASSAAGPQVRAPQGTWRAAPRTEPQLSADGCPPAALLAQALRTQANDHATGRQRTMAALRSS